MVRARRASVSQVGVWSPRSKRATTGWDTPSCLASADWDSPWSARYLTTSMATARAREVTSRSALKAGSFIWRANTSSPLTSFLGLMSLLGEVGQPLQSGIDPPPEPLRVDLGFWGDGEDDEPLSNPGVERPPPATPTRRTQLPQRGPSVNGALMRERQSISQGNEFVPRVLNGLLVPGVKAEQLAHGVLVEVNDAGRAGPSAYSIHAIGRLHRRLDRSLGGCVDERGAGKGGLLVVVGHQVAVLVEG